MLQFWHGSRLNPLAPISEILLVQVALSKRGRNEAPCELSSEKFAVR